jgi:hypothetical protein
MFMHSLGIANDEERGPLTTREFASSVPSIHDIRVLGKEDYSFLFRLVFALAYGERLAKHQNNPSLDDSSDKAWTKLFSAVYVIMDLIRNLRNENTAGVVREVVTRHLTALGFEKNGYKLLNELGLCNSYSTMRRVTLKDVANKIENGPLVDAGAHDVTMAALDNSGSAERVGYLQTILFIIIIVQVRILVTEGHYRDPDNPVDDTHLKSRDNGKTWDEERQKQSVDHDKVIAPKTEHFEYTANCLFGMINGLLVSISNNKMMTPEQAGEYLQQNSVDFMEKLDDPRFGLMKPQFEEEERFEVELDVETVNENDDDEEDESCWSTHLSANNAYVDAPMMADLNTRKAVDDESMKTYTTECCLLMSDLLTLKEKVKTEGPSHNTMPTERKRDKMRLTVPFLESYALSNDLKLWGMVRVEPVYCSLCDAKVLFLTLLYTGAATLCPKRILQEAERDRQD